MSFQTVNGIRIYYEEYGTGFPVLLIQGLGYPSGMWFMQIPEFSKYFRTIVFDNRGAGKIPGSRLEIFPEAAHLLFLEEARAVNRMILAYLRDEKDF